MPKSFESRKFVLAVLLVLLASLLLVGGFITQATWLSVITLAGGGYFVANVAQKGVEQLVKPKEGA